MTFSCVRVFMWLSVSLSVRAVKGKRLELWASKSVMLEFMAGFRHTLTLRSKGQRMGWGQIVRDVWEPLIFLLKLNYPIGDQLSQNASDRSLPDFAGLVWVTTGVFTIGPLGPWPPFELRLKFAYGQKCNLREVAPILWNIMCKCTAKSLKLLLPDVRF